MYNEISQTESKDATFNITALNSPYIYFYSVIEVRSHFVMLCWDKLAIFKMLIFDICV